MERLRKRFGVCSPERSGEVRGSRPVPVPYPSRPKKRRRPPVVPRQWGQHPRPCGPEAKTSCLPQDGSEVPPSTETPERATLQPSAAELVVRRALRACYVWLTGHASARIASAEGLPLCGTSAAEPLSASPHSALQGAASALPARSLPAGEPPLKHWQRPPSAGVQPIAWGGGWGARTPRARSALLRSFLSVRAVPEMEHNGERPPSRSCLQPDAAKR